MDAPEVEVRARRFELYPPRTRCGLDPRLPGDFAARLARLRKAYLELRRPCEPSSLRVVDLAPLKERLGPRWSDLRPLLFANVEACIARRLEADELYVAADETTLWVFLLGPSRADLDRRGALIAADITERLLGVAPGACSVDVRALPFDYQSELATVAGMLGLRERVRRAERRRAEDEARLLTDHAAELVALYRPVLALRLARIVGYRAFARYAAPGGAMIVPATLCPEPATGAFDAELDRWLLEQACRHLAPDKPSEGLPMLAVPVHRATLATPGFRNRWQETLATVPPSRAGRLILELLDPGPGRCAADLRALVAPLDGRFGFLVVRVPPSPAAIAALACSGARAASIDASSVDPADAALLDRLAELVTACREAGLRSLLVPVSTVAMAERARAAGIDYISGDACLPPSRTPGPPFDLFPRQGAESA
ncbi:MAG: EAL domain-containing protein [Geminicoccaceae bacterium]|nr:EAL domain-containing protein [Geminicoccaceae bacterium]